MFSVYSSLLDALIDFKSVLDTILLLQPLWNSWKPIGEQVQLLVPSDAPKSITLPKENLLNLAPEFFLLCSDNVN